MSQTGYDGRPACSAITECLADETCRSQYNIAESRAMAVVQQYAPWFECEHWHHWAIVARVGTLVPLGILVLLPVWNLVLA